jgi:hypothetical protein
VGGAGLYLLGMDLSYDPGHGIYGSDSGGVIELVIDLLIAGASIRVFTSTWRYRTLLLNESAPR